MISMYLLLQQNLQLKCFLMNIILHSDLFYANYFNDNCKNSFYDEFECHLSRSASEVVTVALLCSAVFMKRFRNYGHLQQHKNICSHMLLMGQILFPGPRKLYILTPTVQFWNQNHQASHLGCLNKRSYNPHLDSPRENCICMGGLSYYIIGKGDCCILMVTTSNLWDFSLDVVMTNIALWISAVRAVVYMVVLAQWRICWLWAWHQWLNLKPGSLCRASVYWI